MSVSRFPDPRRVRGDVVAFGEDLSADTLIEAYRKGIFPWPHEGYPLPWFSPRRRTILLFGELHVARSLAKERRRQKYRFTVDRDFSSVIAACSQVPRIGQGGTWIHPEIVRAYVTLHQLGIAHSVEVWADETLVGGLYGIDSGGVFTGESMFHHQPDASKLALLYLIDHLTERGADWLDCQVMTPHMQAFGARDVARSVFLDMLTTTQGRSLSLF